MGTIPRIISSSDFSRLKNTKYRVTEFIGGSARNTTSFHKLLFGTCRVSIPNNVSTILILALLMTKALFLLFTLPRLHGTSAGILTSVF